jgi:hypothetical protein
MTTERIGTLLVWPAGNGLWRYLPLMPSPQRNEAGQPNVTVIEAGGMVMLTIGARLQASEAELAAVRQAIARKAGLAPTAVDLRPGDASVSSASLRLIATDKSETQLAAARPSNMPPYAAAFSAMLQGDQALAVKAALPAGRVVVRYDVTLPGTRAATAELSGPWDGAGTVEAAIARGDLRLHTVAEDGASEALINRTVEKAKAEAASRSVSGAATTGFAAPGGACAPAATRAGTFVEVTQTEVVQDNLTLEAGIAGWMK